MLCAVIYLICIIKRYPRFITSSLFNVLRRPIYDFIYLYVFAGFYVSAVFVYIYPSLEANNDVKQMTSMYKVAMLATHIM